jgi:hypothetical protein
MLILGWSASVEINQSSDLGTALRARRTQRVDDQLLCHAGVLLPDGHVHVHVHDDRRVQSALTGLNVFR